MTNEELIDFLKTTKEPVLPETVTENDTRDFKKQWANKQDLSNKEKGELLRDIIAFANTNGKILCYIFYGFGQLIDENGNQRFLIQKFDKQDPDTIKNLINQYIYPQIKADIITVYNEYIQSDIQMIKLYNNTDRPYRIKQSIKGTEFIEGSKYYRVTHSCQRIPATDEERIIEGWKRQDQKGITPNKILTIILCLTILFNINTPLSFIPRQATLKINYDLEYPIRWLIVFLPIFISIIYFWYIVISDKVLGIYKKIVNFSIKKPNGFWAKLRFYSVQAVLVLLGIILGFIEILIFMNFVHVTDNWVESCFRGYITKCFDDSNILPRFSFLFLSISAIIIPFLPFFQPLINNREKLKSAFLKSIKLLLSKV